MPTGSWWVSNNYITRCHRRLELVGVWVAVQFQCQLPAEWEPTPDRGLGPSRPRLSSLAEWGRSAAIVRGTWGQYVAVCSVSNSPLSHNQYQPFRNPFENKVWQVYFSKEVRSFVIIVDYFPMYSCICVMWLYNITIFFKNTDALRFRKFFNHESKYRNLGYKTLMAQILIGWDKWNTRRHHILNDLIYSSI